MLRMSVRYFVCHYASEQHKSISSNAGLKLGLYNAFAK
jgi:hypothetical protein